MRYKIVILGNTGNNPFDAYSWFVRTTAQGFYLNGHEVVGFDYKSHSIEQIRDFLFDYKPNILFTHLTFHNKHDKFTIMDIFNNLRSLIGTIVIHTLSDARTEPRYNGDISHAFDMALISTYKNIDKFQKYWNIPVYYWPYSSLTYDSRGKYKKELDFKKPVFPGNPGSHKDRTEFVQKLQSNMDIKVIKTKSKDDIRNRTLNFSASSSAVLCLSTRYEMNNGFTDVRPYQFGGSGSIMICRPHDIQKYIIPEDLYFTFYSYDNKGLEQVKEHWEKIKKMSDNEKDEMKQKVFDFIQKYHSSKVRMAQTIELIEGKREKLDIFL